MLYKITVVLKEHGEVGDLLACYVGNFLGGVHVWFFSLFFLVDLCVLSDMVLNILKSYVAKMVQEGPSEFSMSLV